MTNEDANRAMNRKIRKALGYVEGGDDERGDEAPTDPKRGDGEETTQPKTDMNAIIRDARSRRRIVAAIG